MKLRLNQGCIQEIPCEFLKRTDSVKTNDLRVGQEISGQLPHRNAFPVAPQEIGQSAYPIMSRGNVVAGYVRLTS